MHVYKLQKQQLTRERNRRTNYPLNKRSRLEKDRAICLRETQQLLPCDSPKESGRTEAVATGRRASPLQLTGLQLQPRFPRQPSIRTPSGPPPGTPPSDSQAVRHGERGGGTTEPSQETGTFLTRDGDPNFPLPSLAAERGAVLTLGRPRGCPSLRRRPPCLGAASPAHRRRRHSLRKHPAHADKGTGCVRAG